MFSPLKIVLLLVLLFVYTHSINSPQVAMVSAVQKLSSTSLIVFHRHGHRATGKGIFATDIAEWSERVCRFGEDKKLDYRFPVINYNVDTKPVDKNSFPFGAISKIGASHMQNVGKSLLETFPCLHNLTTLRTKVHSTNYQRTQMSAQFMLDGLHNALSPETAKVAAQETSDIVVPVKVLDIRNCPITFYERVPKLSIELVKKVQASEQFVARETSEPITRAKNTLLETFPSLGDHWYGFDWSAIHDYFICRRAHGLHVLPQVSHLERLVDSHYIYRYTMYFRDAQHQALFVLPALREVLRTVLAQQVHITASSADAGPTVRSGGGGGGTALSVYSSHDITLYGLLHGLGAQQTERNWALMRGGDFLATLDSSARNYTAPFWPNYGSTLVFKAEHSSVSSSNQQQPVCENLDQLRISAHLDLQPLKLNLQRIDRILSRSSVLTSGADDDVAADAADDDDRQYSDHFTVGELKQLIAKLSVVEKELMDNSAV